MGKVQGSIEVRDVGFRYGNREVNRGINLEIAARRNGGVGRPQRLGQKHAGQPDLPLLRCVRRRHSEWMGWISAPYAISDYRQNIGLVLQEPFLFFGTIADNIAYGKPARDPCRDHRRRPRRACA